MKSIHFAILLSLAVALTVNQAYAIDADIGVTVDRFNENLANMPKTTPTDKMPHFLNLDAPCNGMECYVATNRPTPVNFDLKAVDYLGFPLTVMCEHQSGHTFPVGKTRNQCYAKDLFQNEIRGSFVVTVGYKITSIPKWYKNTAHFWVSNQIGTSDYLKSLEYLLNHNIISIPTVKHSVETNAQVPSWVIQTTKDWSDNKTGDHEYSIAISWLVENGYVHM
jgi:hypothetical protein